MHEATWTESDRTFAHRLDQALAVALDHDPAPADILPGGELGNHGIDAEFDGLRAADCAVDGNALMLRCAGGSGWHLDPLGRRQLYPHVGELVCRTAIDLVEPHERDTVQAWVDEGVPVRLRGLVGNAPLLVLDDGWRTVVLPRPTLAWSITAS